MTRAFLLLVLLTFAVMLLVSAPQLADPLIRFDDFPAYFGDEHLFYEKTLSEGRWLNYWWIARPFIWSPTTNFMVYQLAWAVFAAAASLNALGPNARPFHTYVLAILIALSPQAFLISGWFNTLILGAWVIALFAVISLYVSNRTMRWLFLIFAPISMMAYSTYPLMLAALCLTRHDARRSLADLVGLVALLALSIGLGMLLMYSINYLVHGYFGIAIAEWREPNPATTFEGLRANAERLMPQFMGRLFISSAFGEVAIGVLNLALLAAAFAVLLVKRPGVAVYIATGIAVSIALVAVHGLKEGVAIPMRALISVWVLFAITLIKALAESETPRLRNAATVSAIFLAAIYAGQLLKHAGHFVQWQTESRAIAESVPKDVDAIFVYGDVSRIPGVVNAYIQHPLGLTERIRMFSGVPTFPCRMVVEIVCVDEPPFQIDGPSDKLRIKVIGSNAVVQLPAPQTLAVAGN